MPERPVPFSKFQKCCKCEKVYPALQKCNRNLNHMENNDLKKIAAPMVENRASDFSFSREREDRIIYDSEDA